jgi:hypothetical protein
MFRRATPGSLELIDIHNKYPGLKARRGMVSWTVCVNKEKKRENFDNLLEEKKLKDEEHFYLLNNY